MVEMAQRTAVDCGDGTVDSRGSLAVIGMNIEEVGIERGKDKERW